MSHVFNFLLVLLLLVNLLGLMLWVMRLSRLPLGLAKAATVVGGSLLFFFLEHFVGLGALGWLLPVLTIGALWGIWEHFDTLRHHLGAEVAFLLAFGYALLWRYTFPDIDPQSEKLADLNFVTSYMQGLRLPAPDLWLPPYKLTQYYAFQHYAAGLLGRILSVPSGTAYNLAYCVITGLVVAPAYDFVRVFTKSRWRQGLILAALLVGGTGASALTPFTMKNEQTFSSMRFIGGTSVAPLADLTPLGVSLRKLQYGDVSDEPTKREYVLDLPMEVFSYVVELGDYHAPLGGFVLLTMALAAFGVLLGRPEAVPRRWATGLLTGTVPMCIVTNAWCFPLQGLLVAASLAFLWRYRERPRWEELIGTSLISWVLLYPWLACFCPRVIPYKMKLVGWDQHTPLIVYLLQFWPILALTVLAWFAAGKGKAVAIKNKAGGRKKSDPVTQFPDLREYRWFALLVAGFLVLIEVLNVDDIYGGHFERFNTAFKWWPWVAALSLLLLASLCLADLARSRTAQVGAIVILLGLLTYTHELGREWYLRPKTVVGQLDGSAWMRYAGQDAEARKSLSITASIMNYLTANAGGVVLEPPVPDRSAFVETGAMPLFTGHPTVLGWYPHEQLWRGYQRDIEQRWNRTSEFFRGESTAALDLLEAYDVRFILWPGTRMVSPELFNKIKAQVESRYTFVRFEEGQPQWGIWERKQRPDAATPQECFR